MAEQEPKDSLRTVLEQVKIGIKEEAGNVVDENALDPGNRSAIDSASYRLEVLQKVEALLTKGIEIADYVSGNGGYASLRNGRIPTDNVDRAPSQTDPRWGISD